jgi:hypothetical protein
MDGKGAPAVGGNLCGAGLLASATNHNPPGSSITQSTGFNDLSKISNTNEQKESSNCKCLPFLHCLSCLAEYKKEKWRRLMVDCTLLLLVM